jgi:mono/diheme cytochrome c family protein
MLAAVAAVGLSKPRSSYANSPQGTPASAPGTAVANGSKQQARVERGKYLVATSACNDCHTPLKMGASGPEPDMTRMLSGHPETLKVHAPKAGTPPWVVAVTSSNTAWAGPWGVSFTANLTPDAETGLGTWSEEEFVQTIRTGRHRARGRALLPPMPIPAYSQFNDEDLRAIYAYLRAIPVVRNRVPNPIVP